MNESEIKQKAFEILAEACEVDTYTLNEHINDDSSVLQLNWCLEAIENALRYKKD